MSASSSERNIDAIQAKRLAARLLCKGYGYHSTEVFAMLEVLIESDVALWTVNVGDWHTWSEDLKASIQSELDEIRGSFKGFLGTDDQSVEDREAAAWELGDRIQASLTGLSQPVLLGVMQCVFSSADPQALSDPPVDSGSPYIVQGRPVAIQFTGSVDPSKITLTLSEDLSEEQYHPSGPIPLSVLHRAQEAAEAALQTVQETEQRRLGSDSAFGVTSEHAIHVTSYLMSRLPYHVMVIEKETE